MGRISSKRSDAPDLCPELNRLPETVQRYHNLVASIVADSRDCCQPTRSDIEDLNIRFALSVGMFDISHNIIDIEPWLFSAFCELDNRGHLGFQLVRCRSCALLCGQPGRRP